MVCRYLSCAEHTEHKSSVCQAAGRDCEGADHNCADNPGLCGPISAYGWEQQNRVCSEKGCNRPALYLCANRAPLR